MAQSKTQAVAKVKATSKYKKASPAAKRAMRQEAIRKWNTEQPKNYKAADMGGKYNYSRAMLEATPELLAIFRTAYIKEWTEDKIVAEIQNTTWFRENSVNWKEVEKTRLQNPGEFRSALAKRRAEIEDAANQLGASVTGEELDKLANDALYGNWSQSQLRRYVSAEIDIQQTGGLMGDAGQEEMRLRKVAAENGVEYSDEWFRTQARSSATSGTLGNPGQADLLIRQDAANTYVQYKDAILKGGNLSTLAGNYLRSLEKTYDMADGSASLFDPNIKKALQGRDEQGNPTTTPMWQFEENLRRDPKWLTTKNGAETMSNVAGGLLQEWGFLNNG